MKYLKMLTSVAVILMAFSGTALATTLTSPSGGSYTGTFEAKSTNLSWDGTFITISCESSSLSGNVEEHGSSVTTEINLASLSFNGCNYQFTVQRAGSLVIHTDSSISNGNGTITSKGLELTIETSVGACIFTTAITGTHIGVITGSDSGNAGWDINSSPIPRTGGSFLCGSSATLTGTYTIKTPSTLTVD